MPEDPIAIRIHEENRDQPIAVYPLPLPTRTSTWCPVSRSTCVLHIFQCPAQRTWIHGLGPSSFDILDRLSVGLLMLANSS